MSGPFSFLTQMRSQSYLLELKLWSGTRYAPAMSSLNRTCWNWNTLPQERFDTLKTLNRTCWNWNTKANCLSMSERHLSIVPVGIETKGRTARGSAPRSLNRTCWNWNLDNYTAIEGIEVALNRTCWNWNSNVQNPHERRKSSQSYLLELKHSLNAQPLFYDLALNRTCWNWNRLSI